MVTKLVDMEMLATVPVEGSGHGEGEEADK